MISNKKLFSYTLPAVIHKDGERVRDFCSGEGGGEKDLSPI